MPGFAELEQAALHAIFKETPELCAGLEEQLSAATVTERQNIGAGFFTAIHVPATVESIESPRVLGHITHARVDSINYGLGFVLFMEDGRLNLLEGYSCGGEKTTDLHLEALTFKISDTPFDT